MTFKVRGGPGSEASSNALSILLNNWFTNYGPSDIFRTCENCRHMTEGSTAAHCKKFNMTPPASVIIAGCDAHDDKMEIPF